MIFEKTVENYVDRAEDIYLEIETNMEWDLSEGINVSMVGVANENLIANFILSYPDVMKLHEGLTRYICEVQHQLAK